METWWEKCFMDLEQILWDNYENDLEWFGHGEHMMEKL